MCTFWNICSVGLIKVGHILKFVICYTIQHIVVPFCSVRLGNFNFRESQNSKFVIFPQLFPCIIYKIWGIKRQNPANNFFLVFEYLLGRHTFEMVRDSAEELCLSVQLHYVSRCGNTVSKDGCIAPL